MSLGIQTSALAVVLLRHLFLYLMTHNGLCLEDTKWNSAILLFHFYLVSSVITPLTNGCSRGFINTHQFIHIFWLLTVKSEFKYCGFLLMVASYILTRINSSPPVYIPLFQPFLLKHSATAVVACHIIYCSHLYWFFSSYPCNYSMRRLHWLNESGTENVIWPEFLQLVTQISYQKADFNYIESQRML